MTALGSKFIGQLRLGEDALQQGQPEREESGVGRGHHQGVRTNAGRARDEGEQGQLLGLQPGEGLLAQGFEGLTVLRSKRGLSVGWSSAITMQSGSRRRM
jgi:hypothetical protein